MLGIKLIRELLISIALTGVYFILSRNEKFKFEFPAACSAG
jgi:hypothetical protein